MLSPAHHYTARRLPARPPAVCAAGAGLLRRLGPDAGLGLSLWTRASTSAGSSPSSSGRQADALPATRGRQLQRVWAASGEVGAQKQKKPRGGKGGSQGGSDAAPPPAVLLPAREEAFMDDGDEDDDNHLVGGQLGGLGGASRGTRVVALISWWRS